MTRVLIHRSLTRPVLFLEMEREYAIVVAMLHGLLAYAYMSLPVGIAAAMSLAGFYWAGRAMAKQDPQMLRVIGQEVENKGTWLSASTHPLGPPANFLKK